MKTTLYFDSNCGIRTGEKSAWSVRCSIWTLSFPMGNGLNFLVLITRLERNRSSASFMSKQAWVLSWLVLSTFIKSLADFSYLHSISFEGTFLLLEAATRGVLWKKMFFEISQNSQENTRVSFLIKLQEGFFWILEIDEASGWSPSDFHWSQSIPECIKQIFLGPFLNTLSHLAVRCIKVAVFSQF